MLSKTERQVEGLRGVYELAALAELELTFHPIPKHCFSADYQNLHGCFWDILHAGQGVGGIRTAQEARSKHDGQGVGGHAVHIFYQSHSGIQHPGKEILTLLEYKHPDHTLPEVPNDI